MANLSRGLGKGLGALLGDAALRADTSENLQNLPISQIECNADQPRRRFDETALAELADSIREHGVLQPVTVRRLGTGYYQLVAGERRWRAARQAGQTEIPAIIIEADDRKATELALIENLQREDLNPIEEAEGYQKLMDGYHMTQEDVAERVGKSRPAVTNALRLLALCPEVRELVEEGRLSGGHARALLTLPAEQQKCAAKTVVEGGLSVRRTEALVKTLRSRPEAGKETESETINYAKLAASELADKLGRGCRIVPGRRKGRVELDYYGTDDLNDLLDALALIRKRNGK